LVQNLTGTTTFNCDSTAVEESSRNFALYKKQIASRTGRKENQNFNKKGQKHLLNISKAIWTSLETKCTGKLT